METDKRLVEKAKLGKKQAFEKLVIKYQGRILNLVYDFVGNYAKAQNIAGEVFIRAQEKLNTIEQRANFSSWLYRIAVNMSVDFARKETKKTGQELDMEYQKHETENEFPEPEVIPEKNKLYKNIESAFEKLSDYQRISIVLRYFHNLKIKEVAEIMECDEDAVRIHMFSGVQKFGKDIRELS